MIGYDVEKIVRLALDDTVAGAEKWTIEDMVTHINSGVIAINNNWPESMLAEDGSKRTVTPITKASGTINLSDKYLQTLAYFVTSKCFETKGSGKENKLRATENMQLFNMGS